VAEGASTRRLRSPSARDASDCTPEDRRVVIRLLEQMLREEELAVSEATQTEFDPDQTCQLCKQPIGFEYVQRLLGVCLKNALVKYGVALRLESSSARRAQSGVSLLEPPVAVPESGPNSRVETQH